MPRWYRGVPPWLSWLVVALALMVGLVVAARATVDAIRADERRAVLAEGQSLTTAMHTIERGRWARERDSLRALAGQRDTVLRTRLQFVHDTTWLPADTAPTVRYVACRAQLDTLAEDCGKFRWSATQALLAADSLHAADSLATTRLAVQLAAIRRSDSTKAVQLNAQSRWRTLERGVCAGSVGFNIFTILKD